MISSEISLTFLIELFASLRAFLILTLAFSVSALAIFDNSIRLSSVSGGIFIMIKSPLLDGAKPKLALIIAFSISGIKFFSHGCTVIVLASGVLTFAT